MIGEFQIKKIFSIVQILFVFIIKSWSSEAL